MQGVSSYHSSSAVAPESEHKTRVSAFDYLLLRNTNAKTPMTIVGCMCCEMSATAEQVRRTALTLCAVHERLRCRVVGREWIESEVSFIPSPLALWQKSTNNCGAKSQLVYGVAGSLRSLLAARFASLRSLLITIHDHIHPAIHY